MLALAHRHRHLDETHPVPDRHHDALDLRVVVRAGRRRTGPIARRFSAWKPEVVSVSRCRAISETTRARMRMPTRRAADER